MSGIKQSKQDIDAAINNFQELKGSRNKEVQAINNITKEGRRIALNGAYQNINDVVTKIKQETIAQTNQIAAYERKITNNLNQKLDQGIKSAEIKIDNLTNKIALNMQKGKIKQWQWVILLIKILIS